MRRLRYAPAMLALALTTGVAPALAADTPAARTDQPTRSVTLSVGVGQLVRLPRPVTDVFVADEKIGDVQVKGRSQLYLFGKAPGETSVYATDGSGATVWSAIVRVGANLGSIGPMLKLAMPEAQITATPLSGMVVLTGQVASPGQAAEAQHLVEAYVGPGTTILNKLRCPTPLQVNLRVKIVEVNRAIAKTIGVNLLSRDTGGPVFFGIAQGDAGTLTPTKVTDPATGVTKSATEVTIKSLGGTTLGLAGRALGVDLLGTLQLAETQGLATTLAEPNITAISGEPASFLAGGEIPIPFAEGFGSVSVTYKPYGVSLYFVPTVLADGRISLHVKPEVSELTDAGSVKINNFILPALTVRRAETTVELGSGQSFAIGGLLQNSRRNSTSKAPFLGDLPVIGALFRSNDFKRNETELVIVVTPYIVKPVDANRIALPTDGYRAPTDVERVFLNKEAAGDSGASRPKPTAADPSKR